MCTSSSRFADLPFCFLSVLSVLSVVSSSSSASEERHWAFQPVKAPPLPAVRESAWPRTSIDRFILAKLEERGLKPSAPADRRTLLRRVTFDLIGLPPTPEEIAAFEADRSPDALAKVVDRLLASPHYGERWGRHWLDVARYADTKGYVFFEEQAFPWACTYRDYVIRAFNEDLPYDQFIVQQLAADRLPLGDDRRPLAALGFLTLGGRFMNNPHDIIDDRIDVVTRGLLGLTVTCARCHDHKFDPIPTKDYYSLYGVFASSVEPIDAAAVRPIRRRRRRMRRSARSWRARASWPTSCGPSTRSSLESARTRAAEYLLAAPRHARSTANRRFHAHRRRQRSEPRHDRALAGVSEAHAQETSSGLRSVAPVRRVVGEGVRGEGEQAVRANGQGDRRQTTASIRWWPSASRRSRRQAEGRGRSATASCSTARRRSGKKRFSAAASKQPPPAALPDPAAKNCGKSFTVPTSAPERGPRACSANWSYCRIAPRRASCKSCARPSRNGGRSGAGAPPRAMRWTIRRLPISRCVFQRGNPNNRGASRCRASSSKCWPERGASRFTHGSGRLELARAIADRNNPLTARVLVNRVWLHHFGKGLVGTPSDFGLRSDPPTPSGVARLSGDDIHGRRLVDQEAAPADRAVRRRISRRSDDRPDGRRVDPENALLWQMNRRRLDFEATRDALLAVSGRLDRTPGGPPVKDMLSARGARRDAVRFPRSPECAGTVAHLRFPQPRRQQPPAR